MSVRSVWLMVGIIGMVATAAVGAVADDYEAEIAEFRADQEERLRSDNSWLTVAGLFFLTEGTHRFGTGTLNDFVLPPGSAPEEIGVFEYHDSQTTVCALEGTTITVNGAEVASAVLHPSGEGRRRPDQITIGSLTMWVHLSGDRKAIRLRDLNSQIRREFTGRRWFPADKKYRVVARFEPLPEPEPLEVPNILGDIERYTATGFVHFELEGQPYRMKAIGRGERGLWFLFHDLTSGKETYPAVRPFTTCPLPLPENRLKVRIAAGELNYHTTDETAAGG